MTFVVDFSYKISRESVILCLVERFESYLNKDCSVNFWKLNSVLNQVEHNTLIELEISV